MFSFRKKAAMPSAADALPGRAEPIPTARRHFVNGRELAPPYPEGCEQVLFGMGCFWGAEKAFWSVPDVWVTAVGYSGGSTPNPTYEEVCTGMTGQNEVVLVVYDPAKLSFDELLRIFWEGHDPTQGMRQGNDVGTQYRSAIYCTTPGQIAAAEASRKNYEERLSAAGYGMVSTEIAEEGPFYFAEDYHQQYLAKNPHGYCGHGGTGVACPIGTGVTS
jgi:peptide-methionine (S)-S-oxide reductase